MMMDASKEGWVGIPHGGIGMGAMMDLTGYCDHCTSNGDFRYPVQCSFRMGGSEGIYWAQEFGQLRSCMTVTARISD